MTKIDIMPAAALLRQSRYAVALSGAGISTPSGIPDFRSANSGLWENVDPAVATIDGFRRNPEAFFNWVRPLATKILRAKPNAAHQALVALERRGTLRAVITQNIDLLHSRAGSQTVYEVHGHLRENVCLACKQVYEASGMLKRFVDSGKLPHCKACNGILKPNVILFGEMLPFMTFTKAEAAARACDTMLIVGSSLEVAPVSELPLLARQTGASLIIVNREATQLDGYADVVLRGDVSDILPRLAAAVDALP